MHDRVGFPRWFLRALGVLAVGLLVSALGDVRFGSGSDAGGKLATAAVMAERFTCDPDVGWWAAGYDPEADLHQLVYTEAHGDLYVQATSLAYQCAVMPLQRALGPWGPVLASLLGAVAAGLAAARIAWRLGGGPAAEITAFWLVGLFGPAFFYGLDVWEHAPGLGLAAWAVALALGPATPRRAAAAGVLGALAVTFRAEMALVLAALVAAAVTVPEVRRRWLGRPAACAAGALAAAAVTGAYLLLERLVVTGSVRGDRSTDLASQAGAELGERLTTGLVTTVGLFASDQGPLLLVGALLAAGLLVHGLRAATGDAGDGDAGDGDGAGPTVPAGVQATYGAGILVRGLRGLGFVPGALPAAPMAAAGLFTGRRSPEHRLLVRTALTAPVLVVLLQWPGNLVAQWGGRYLLAPSLLLTAAGCSVLGGRGRRTPVATVSLVLLSVAMGTYGAAWHVARSNEVAATVEAIEAGPADGIVLTTVVHLARDAGGTYGDRRWLVADDDEELELATGIVAAERPSALVVVTPGTDDPPDLGAAGDGYELVGEALLDHLGSPLRVQRFERTFPR